MRRGRRPRAPPASRQLRIPTAATPPFPRISIPPPAPPRLSGSAPGVGGAESPQPGASLEPRTPFPLPGERVGPAPKPLAAMAVSCFIIKSVFFSCLSPSPVHFSVSLLRASVCFSCSLRALASQPPLSISVSLFLPQRPVPPSLILPLASLSQWPRSVPAVPPSPWPAPRGSPSRSHLLLSRLPAAPFSLQVSDSLHLGPAAPPRLGRSLPSPLPPAGGGRCCDATGRGQEGGADAAAASRGPGLLCGRRAAGGGVGCGRRPKKARRLPSGDAQPGPALPCGWARPPLRIHVRVRTAAGAGEVREEVGGKGAPRARLGVARQRPRSGSLCTGGRPGGGEGGVGGPWVRSGMGPDGGEAPGAGSLAWRGFGWGTRPSGSARASFASAWEARGVREADPGLRACGRGRTQTSPLRPGPQVPEPGASPGAASPGLGPLPPL